VDNGIIWQSVLDGTKHKGKNNGLLSYDET
jgi:hypothetical protein